jgi:hypothetical protein
VTKFLLEMEMALVQVLEMEMALVQVLEDHQLP